MLIITTGVGDNSNGRCTTRFNIYILWQFVRKWRSLIGHTPVKSRLEKGVMLSINFRNSLSERPSLRFSTHCNIHPTSLLEVEICRICNFNQFVCHCLKYCNPIIFRTPLLFAAYLKVRSCHHHFILSVDILGNNLYPSWSSSRKLVQVVGGVKWVETTGLLNH